jgi:hypothetical protein
LTWLHAGDSSCFAAVAAALADAGRPSLAIVLGAAVAMHLVFTFALDQR